MSEKSQFDIVVDRRKTHARKWDEKIISEKFHLTEDVIPLDLADMDFACFEGIERALVARAHLGDYSYTYATDAFFESVQSWHKRRFDVLVEKEWIRLVFGTVSTLHYIVQAFTDPAESVMIHTPVYDPFQEAITNNGRKCVPSPLLLSENRYFLDFADMERKFRDEKVKVLIFCSPHNPGGRVWSKEELERVCDLCVKYDVLLVSDEVHREILVGNVSFTSILEMPAKKTPKIILCCSPNKSFNIGGLKTSYVVIPNPLLRETFYKQLTKNAISSPHVFAIPAITAAYNEGEMWLDELNEYMKGNFTLLYAFFEKHLPKAKVMQTDASFLAWIDMREMFNSEEALVTFFARVNLTVVKGSYFGEEGRGFARIVVAMPRSVLEIVLKRLKESYENWEKERV